MFPTGAGRDDVFMATTGKMPRGDLAAEDVVADGARPARMLETNGDECFSAPEAI